MAKKNNRKRSIEDEIYEVEQMSLNNKNKQTPNFKINIKFKNKKQKELYDLILNNRIIFINGSPGTGKSIIALMAGLECLRNKNININQIILTKPIVEVSKSLGALPGDLNEKTFPFYTHFYDNLVKIIGNEAVKYLRESGQIKETILNYLRGTTFGTYDENGNSIGSFCFFDEIQNTTITEVKTFISRMGENTTLVLAGDLDQIDIKLGMNEKSGFQHAWEILQDIPGIVFFEFTDDDIVREKFLIDIMKRYKNNPK